MTVSAKALKEQIQNIRKLSGDIYLFTISSGHVSREAMPGQFINIKCSEGMETILRRPVSILSADRVKGTFDIAFQVRGKGTALIADKSYPGGILDFIGPLGNTFDISTRYRKIAVIGGGIGIFPLLFLLEEIGRLAAVFSNGTGGITRDAFIGFRDIGAAVLVDEFKAASESLHIATDDGSCGSRGFITDICESSADISSYDIIYTCGPEPMMKKAAASAARSGVRCQVSLEQRMGCVIGACLVCSCRTIGPDGTKGYSRTCSDGPVFPAGAIDWDYNGIQNTNGVNAKCGR